MTAPFVTLSAWERKEVADTLEEAGNKADGEARSGDALLLWRVARLIREANTVCCYGVADE